VKSSDARLRSDLIALGVALFAALAIGSVRARVAGLFHQAKTDHDTYTLPSPQQTVAVSLGWRSALADLVYAHVLVSYGLHFQEKRRFEFVGNYLETVNELDPKFRAPYRFADTLLTLGPIAPREKDYYQARKILERGMNELPYDSELWNTAGQFMAYLAPTAFKDPKVKEEWRLEGARRLARACELIGSDENIPFHCITAAGIFSKAGQREAMIQFLQRLLVVSDNDDIRQLALGYLGKVAGERERDEAEWRDQRFMVAWGKDLSHVTKNMVLVVGPPLDAAKCAGAPARYAPECAATWRSFGERSARR
jgi:tetratricopeptide (TPR) repeat protein